jgi:hypothetical protein
MVELSVDYIRGFVDGEGDWVQTLVAGFGLSTNVARDYTYTLE